MSQFLVRTDHSGGIVEIALNRAPVNALSAPFLQELAATFEALGQDPEVRAIVLTSPFKVFSAGLDLKEAQGFDLADEQAIVGGLNTGFLALFACPKPTLVAVEGAAIAGGLFFVLASDVRVAGPHAKFGLAEVRVGADFPVGPLEIARATLSVNDLRWLMLSGEPIEAEAAVASGMIDEVTDAGAAREQALVMAQDMARIPPLTYARVKRQIRGEVIDRIEAAMAAGANMPEDGWFNSETKAAMRRMIGDAPRPPEEGETTS